MAFPDTSDRQKFPGFFGCPIADAPAPADDWWLWVEVKENMTITKPTLVVGDRDGVDFAVMWEDTSMDLRGFRKGYTLVIPRPWRTKPEEGKKGFVTIAKGDGGVRCVGKKLDVVLGLVERQFEEDVCGACRKKGETKRCTGCGRTTYCGKDCQVKAWNDGHKADCKALKALGQIWE